MRAAGLADAHPGLQDRILLNCTRIENAHKVRKKTFNSFLCIEVQWRSQPKHLGAKLLDFRRITLFYLEKRLSNDYIF